MKSWSTACPDWEKRIVEGRSLIAGKPLFQSAADDALDVFKSLRIVDAPGRPTFGQSGEQWVFDFVSAVFGAYDEDSGQRLINEFFLCVSKKNGKSTIAAGIMLTALIVNWRESNELIIVAPTIKAANNTFKPAADMIRADPKLSADENGFLHVVDHQRTIKHLKTGATLQILAADTGTVAGNKAAFVLVEELWEFGKKNGVDSMMREATGGLIARPEGFLISITTQSDGPPSGFFKDKLDYARDVRDGKITDNKFLPVIYEFPQSLIDSGEFMEPENYYITNPHLGHLDWGKNWIQDELAKEMAKGPETRNVFLAKHLNVQIGSNLRSNRWPGADYWASRTDPTLNFDSLLDRCEVCVIGIDGGGLDDLFGLTVIGREKGKWNWLSWSHAWCHTSVLERRKSIAAHLQGFQKDGDLTIVDDELKDISGIVAVISMVKERGLLASVAVDPVGLGDMVEALDEIGVSQEEGNLEAVAQGWRMATAIKSSERRLVNGTLHHAPSTMMDWCVSNLKIEPTATAIRATKQNAGDAKIDPVMALFDAVTVMSRNPEAKGPSVYETRGILVV